MFLINHVHVFGAHVLLIILQFPKSIKEDKIDVYGCFCSPECVLSYLKKENIDSSTLWHRYSLLNIIYGEIYNYEKH